MKERIITVHIQVDGEFSRVQIHDKITWPDIIVLAGHFSAAAGSIFKDKTVAAILGELSHVYMKIRPHPRLIAAEWAKAGVGDDVVVKPIEGDMNLLLNLNKLFTN